MKLKTIKPKYFFYIFTLLLILFIINSLYYSNNTELFTQNDRHDTRLEGFEGPKFMDQKEKNKPRAKKSRKAKTEDFVNPLGYFGFKYAKKDNFNNTNNEENSTQNALDEADRLDVNSLSINSMKGILHSYNKNISDRLKKVENDNGLVKVMEQGKVFYDEFRKLFDIGLFI